MTISKEFINYDGYEVPEIKGAGGGKGGGKVSPNSLFSTDFLFLTTAIGEGPVYRINPNGPQDIQIQDSSIDDLINLDGDGKVNTANFNTAIAYGTTTQGAIPAFGDSIVSPQGFASPVALRYGNITNIPKNYINSQETSASDWDRLVFIFSIDQLSKSDSKGNVGPYSLELTITIYPKSDPVNPARRIISKTTVNGKTDKPVKRTVEVAIPAVTKDTSGYVFTVEKSSLDSDDSKINDLVSIIGWNEIEDTKQAYPRTAMIGYALKAVNEHTGGIPTFTSMTKGLLVKVPSNYNQPILSGTQYPGRDGEIDWRQLEVPEASTSPYGYSNTSIGYYLQKPGSGTKQFTVNPQIYVGAWDGTFIYSWTQNPVWILYDILTNQTYGLGIPEKNIDKFKFYQVAQYCDACDPITGKFIGVDGLADGSYRNKPTGLYTAIRQNQVGLPNGTPIKERRFVSDISITEQEKGMDLLNKIAATFRGALVYASGKITLAVDMPNEYPAMMFNEATIKSGSFQISGTKESDIYTGVDVSYIDPTNHFKRETVRVNSADANDGTDVSDIENIATIDLFGVTRRSQAVRMAQYQLAASKYQRRNVSFTTSTDALNLSPGDVISISTQGTGIAYGYGGKVATNSATVSAANTNVYLENYTWPSIDSSLFTSNTKPLTLRILNQASDRVELYIISNTSYSVSSSSNTPIGSDLITVTALSKFDKTTNTFISLSSGFTSNLVPKAGDLWSIGEISTIGNYYSSKSGKLFKVTNIKRETGSEEISVSGVEYIPNVYVDSDTFINYQPTSYTDIVSPFAPPPTPNFTLTTIPRRKLDGSIVVDGLISTTTNKSGYGQKFETEYYLSTPTSSTLITAYTPGTPIKLVAANSDALANSKQAILTGKNGFSSAIGKVKLLCNTTSIVSSTIELTIEGLSSCTDLNFNKNILDVVTTNSSGLKGTNVVTLPVYAKTASDTVKNFVGYSPSTMDITRDIYSYDLVNNKIVIKNDTANGGILSSALLNPPFYISINQVQDVNYYSNSSFYVEGTSYTYTNSGTLTASAVNTLVIPIKPRKPDFIRLYVDGILQDSSFYTINLNRSLSIPSNVVYTAKSSESVYRVEVDHYTVPTIEVGDRLDVGYANVFYVANTSFDPTSTAYSSPLTSNSIYRIALTSVPAISLAGSRFINTTINPVGIISNTSGNTCTFTYDTSKYGSTFKLGNNSVYTLEIDSNYNRIFLTDDGKLQELPLGTASVKARNKNTIGRTSPYVQQSIVISPIPIQKVTNLTITESLYIEQLSGVAIRATISFDHILNQDVTDYEISYKLTFNDTTSASYAKSLTDYNTVKVPASGADSNTNRISFSLNNINRGTARDTNSLFVTVTPLNKTIRGVTASASKTIVGKTAKPQNVFNFIAGQQNDTVTFLWSYPTDSTGNLQDIDLQGVEIRRVAGVIAATLSNFLVADPVVTVSAGSIRKSIPIDSYGTFTYLAMTKDSSGNYCEAPVGTTLTTVRAQRTSTVFAYSEDDPTDVFSSIPNTNAGETNFPSFANSIKGGLSYPGGTKVDNANGSSSGWSTIAGTPTNLKAIDNAVYITQIRDVGQDITGTVSINTVASQEIQATYNDQHSVVMSLTSVPSTNASILRATNIGKVLGYNNALVTDGRFDSNNKTWMTGPANGNVWAVWNPGINSTDIANANSYALIAGLINANAIALGATYFANGKATGTTALDNVTTIASPIQLVDLKQYNDYASSTYAGELNMVTTQTFIRTTSANVYYANGNVNTSAFSSSSDGFIPYEAGSRTFRYVQLKYIINNSKPDQYDFTLDKFRYTIDKEKTIYSNTVTYSATPTTVDFSSAKFLYRPVITYTVIDQVDALANPVIVVTTASSNNNVSFQLVASKTGTPYLANSTANIMITAIGV